MLEAILEALAGRDYESMARETDLQRAVEIRMATAGLEYRSQVLLDERSPRDRVDLLCGKIAIELKMQGTTTQVLSQLERYAQSAMVDQLVLVTTKAVHLNLRGTVVHGKPIYVVFVGCL